MLGVRFVAMWLLVGVALAALSAPGCNDEAAQQVELRLPASLESRRAELEEYVRAAQARIRECASNYDWERHTVESFMDSVMIFDVKGEFDRTLLRITGSDSGIVLPETYCAALEERTLLAVSPELYARVYPEGIEDKSYEKLLAHEIAHRLHVRVLNGDEDAMGPVWFYEGFALYAADQFRTPPRELSTDEVWRVVGETERGSYADYAYVFRYFAGKALLQELVGRASGANFAEWLHSLEGA